jgi:large subunit ribosomal protein L31
MKDKIHPKYVECKVSCGCGANFVTRSTVPEMKVEICSSCHPYFTGQEKFVDSAGRVERFNRKFGGDYFKKKAPKGGKAKA